MTDRLDPRIHPHRHEMAASWLEGKVQAERFVSGEIFQMRASSAPVHQAPARNAPLLTEALAGELVRVFDVTDGWAWVQLEADSYVGYMPADALREEVEPITHCVRVPRSFVFPAPNIKAQPVEPLSLNAGVTVVQDCGGFQRLSGGGFVHSRHIRPIGQTGEDFVAIAEMFLHAPYLWGGKQSTGLDCSALVQLALQAAGKVCPRDSDMQENALGIPIDIHGFTAARRGDLVFWKGHVAIVIDDDMLIHANAFHMQVAYESFHTAVQRIERDAGLQVTSIRRL